MAAAVRMLRARNVIGGLRVWSMRSDGLRFLGAAAQPQSSNEVDDHPTAAAAELPEVDEAGVNRIVEALKEKTQVDNELMQPWKDLVGSKTMNKVLEQLGCGSTALSFFEWASKQERFDNKNKVESYRLILQRLASAGMGKEVRRVLKDMHESGYFLKKKMFSEVITQLLKSEKSEDVIGIVQDMLQSHWWNVLGEIVQTCYECERIDAACEILELMAAQKGLSNKEAISQLATTVISRNDTEGLMALEKILKSDAEFSVVIDLLCKEQRMEDACRVMDKMAEAGVGPTIFTYSRLVDGFVKSSRIPEALALLDLMREQGCLPSAIVYNHILDGFCKSGKVRKAFKLFKIMLENGCSPTTYTYNTLINGLCLEGKTDKARAVLAKMISGGFVPDVVTYTVLINRLRKDGDIKAAVDLFDEMLSKGCVPDRTTYVCLIAGLCKEKDVEALRSFVEEHRNRFDMDTYLYNLVISTYGKHGKLREAKEFFEEMRSRKIPPTLIVVNSLMSALCQNKQTDEAMEIYRKMAQDRLTPDRYTYTILIGGLCDLGRTDEACALKEAMIQKNCLPDKVTYGVLVAGLIRAGKRFEAEEMKKQMGAAEFPS